MTANELADIVDHWAWKESAEYLTDAATMLRQQTQDIEELKLRISQLLETQDYLYKKHDSDKAKIEELKQIIDAQFTVRYWAIKESD